MVFEQPSGNVLPEDDDEKDNEFEIGNGNNCCNVFIRLNEVILFKFGDMKLLA